MSVYAWHGMAWQSRGVSQLMQPTVVQLATMQLQAVEYVIRMYRLGKVIAAGRSDLVRARCEDLFQNSAW